MDVVAELHVDHPRVGPQHLSPWGQHMESPIQVEAVTWTDSRNSLQEKPLKNSRLYAILTAPSCPQRKGHRCLYSDHLEMTTKEPSHGTSPTFITSF